MSFVLLDAGFLAVSIRHSLLKYGVYFYYRRIPEDLRGHYSGKRFRRISLKTKQPHIAAKKIAQLTSADDAFSSSLRSPESKELGLTNQESRRAAETLVTNLGLAPGDAHRPRPDHIVDERLDDYFERRYGKKYVDVRHDEYRSAEDMTAMFNPVEREAVRLVMEAPKQRRFHLSDALEVYLKHHNRGEQKKFSRDTHNAINHVIGAAGDLPLNLYRTEHANAVRDHLLARSIKTATVRRELNRITSIFNVGLIEFDLGSVKNPFESLATPNENPDADKREPFTKHELQAINDACREKGDDIRHIVALQADTGARISEIVGLRVEDVSLDHKVPHIHIRAHEKLGRTLKTDTSERKVPLVGVALWAAQNAVDAHKKRHSRSGWLFPRYASDEALKATHASNTINKWLQSVTKTDKTSHSFRHSMRDHLRHVCAPVDIQDAIGGWGSKTVGMGYGEGYRLEQLRGYLERVVLE